MRIVDRVASAVLALVLFAGGLVAAVEIVLAGLGVGPWLVPYQGWVEAARTTPWSDADLRPYFAGLIAVGALLIVVEVGRRRPDALPLAARGPGVVGELDRRGVERWLVERVEGVEGVAGANARVGLASAVIETRSVGRETQPVEEAVRQVAGEGLESLGLDRTPRLRVRVRPRQEPR